MQALETTTTTTPVEKKKRGRKPKDASILVQDQPKTIDTTDEQLEKDVESSVNNGLSIDQLLENVISDPMRLSEEFKVIGTLPVMSSYDVFKYIRFYNL